jgi:hypothetical protein
LTPKLDKSVLGEREAQVALDVLLHLRDKYSNDELRAAYDWNNNDVGAFNRAIDKLDEIVIEYRG